MSNNLSPAITPETSVTRFGGVCAAARALNISPSHLSHCLHGRNNPSRKLVAAAAALGIHLERTPTQRDLSPAGGRPHAC